MGWCPIVIWSLVDFSVILRSVIENTFVQFGGSFTINRSVLMGISLGCCIAILYLGQYQ